MLDWQGNKVSIDENPSKRVLAWAFEPGDRGFDVVIIRDYHRALEYASERMEDLMDSAEEKDLIEFGVKLQAKLIWISPAELDELDDQSS